MWRATWTLFWTPQSNPITSHLPRGAEMSNLHILNLASCGITGHLPKDIGTAFLLTFVKMGHNRCGHHMGHNRCKHNMGFKGSDLASSLLSLSCWTAQCSSLPAYNDWCNCSACRDTARPGTHSIIRCSTLCVGVVQLAILCTAWCTTPCTARYRGCRGGFHVSSQAPNT